METIGTPRRPTCPAGPACETGQRSRPTRFPPWARRHQHVGHTFTVVAASIKSVGQDTSEVAGSVRRKSGVYDTLTGSSRRLVLATAWAFVLVGTDVPRIVATELFAVDPGWLLPTQVLLILGLLGLSVLDERFRPLQTVALALLAVTLLALVSVTDVLASLGVALPSGMWTTVANLLLKGLVALGLCAILLARGDDRSSLFLNRGDLSVTAVPERMPGFRRSRSWWRLGAFWAALTTLTTLGFLVVAGARFSFWTLAPSQLFGIAIIVTIGAAVNAAAEEFIFRAAPLADITALFGKNHAMVFLGALFGSSHYYGTPGGPMGVLMTFFLGWWLTKSILETRGIALAWSVHFLLDFVILWAWFLT